MDKNVKVFLEKYRMTVCESIWSFCVYDDPSADLCLHKDLYLVNVHHRAAKRDGVRSPGVRVHTKPWLITNVKKRLASSQSFIITILFFISGRTSILQMQQLR